MDNVSTVPWIKRVICTGCLGMAICIIFSTEAKISKMIFEQAGGFLY